jgi:hypothetical protein
MLLGKQIQILVFKLDDSGTFDNIGEVNQFDSLIWPDKFNGYASFELWAPITDENSEYFKKGNILWCGGDNAAMVEIVKSTIDDKGTKTFNVKGRTLEMLFTTRIIWGTYNGVNKVASTAMYEIVNQNCVNPTNVNRKIPFLELAEDKQIGGLITMQKTGGEVYDSLTTIASNADIGFNMLFRPREKKIIFEVVEGVDRTSEQNIVDPVEFSTDLEDILSSSYYTNDQDNKSVALVMGEGTGSERKSQVSGDNDSYGLGRRELYVDARDLQSETVNEDGTTTSLTPAEYQETLINRGDNKLAEHKVTETFEAQIRVFGEVQYEFGVDYNKGDKVTVRDKQLGVVVSARITEVEEDFDDEYELVLTFGYSYPTIMQKVKQQIT